MIGLMDRTDTVRSVWLDETFLLFRLSVWRAFEHCL